MYSVYLLNDNGEGAYLSVKGRSSWKTLSIARKHANDIKTLINKGKNIFGAVDVWVENEFGEIIN